MKDLAFGIEHRANLAREAAKDLQAHRATVTENASRGVKGYAERAERLETDFDVKVKDLASEIGHRAHLAREVAQGLDSSKTQKSA